jgi:hypothetical protein
LYELSELFIHTPAVLVAIAACCCVVYWRTALRVIFVVVLILVVYGTIVGFHGVSSLVAAHHQ